MTEHMIETPNVRGGDGIVLHDQEGRIMQVNAAMLDMTGYIEAEMLGLNIKELQPKTKRDSDIKPITLDIFDESKVEIIKTVIVRKDGTRFPADVKTSYIRFYHDGDYITVAQRVVRDTKVSDTRDKANRPFVTGDIIQEVDIYEALDSELKYALLEIHDSIRVLEKEIPVDRFKSLLSLSRNSLDYAKDIFSDAVNIMRMSNGDLNKDLNEFSLNELLLELSALYEEQLRKRQIQFYINLDPTIDEVVKADEPKIRYVLERLLRCLLRNNQAGRISLEIESNEQGSLVFRFESSSFMDEELDLNFAKSEMKLDEITINRKHSDFLTSQILTNGYLQSMGGDYSVSEEDGIISVSMVIPVDYHKNLSYSESHNRFLDSQRILFIDEERSSGEVVSNQLASWGADVAYLDSDISAIDQLAAADKDNHYSFIIHNVHGQEGSHAALLRAIATYLDEQESLDKCIYVVFTPGGFPPHVARHFARVRHTHLDSPIRVEYLGNKLARLIGKEEPYPGIIIPSGGTLGEEDKKDISGRILVVDDGKATQKVTAMILSSCGLDVDCADSGIEALNYVEKRLYDVILMDIVMPGMDGIQVTRRIREKENHQRYTPILAITGNLKDSVWKRCVYAGMDDYMTKPIDSQQLIATVKYWMGAVEADDPFNIETDRDGNPKPKKPARPEGDNGLLDLSIIERLKTDTGPEIVAEMIELYQSETNDRMVSIESKIKVGDYDGVATETHGLYCSSGTFGAQKMQEQAIELEQAARNHLPIKCAEVYNRINDTFTQTSTLMSSTLTGLTQRNDFE